MKKTEMSCLDKVQGVVSRNNFETNPSITGSTPVNNLPSDLR